MKNKFLPALFAFVVMFATNQASAYYSPTTGRWLSRDPMGESGFELLRSASTAPRIGQIASTASLPQSRLFVRDAVESKKEPNRYDFVANNPANKIDRLGLATSTTPGSPHVSNDRHNNYLIFSISCPAGFEVRNVTADYDNGNMLSEMYQWYSDNSSHQIVTQDKYDNDINGELDGSFGGIQNPNDYKPVLNCSGNPVEIHAYMRTRLVAPAWYFEAWRNMYGTPDPSAMIGIYQENTRIQYVCGNCCGRGQSN